MPGEVEHAMAALPLIWLPHPINTEVELEKIFGLL